MLLTGVVIEGDKRGRVLGYPTANMIVSQKSEEGVYVSEVKIDGVVYPALTFIGSAKTFGKTDFLSESWLLDFSGNLYGKELSVTLLKKLRGNKKFDSADSLVEQMKQDEREAREYFRQRE